MNQRNLFFLKHFVKIHILGFKSYDYLVKTRHNFKTFHWEENPWKHYLLISKCSYTIQKLLNQ